MPRWMAVWLIAVAIAVATAAHARNPASWEFRHRGSFATDFAAAAASPSGARVLAAGSSGGAAWSDDGGASFHFVSLGTPADATGVAWQDDERVWVSGELPAGWVGAGVLLRSSDGGRTWSTVVADHPVALTSVAFADASHGFAGQAVGGVLATSNGGASWTALSFPGLALAGIEFVTPLIGHAAGTGADFSLARTVDGGASWTTVYTSPTGTVTGISFPNAATGYLASPVAVARSLDGGATWSPRATLTETWIEDLVFADALHGWAGGMRLLTNDGRGRVMATSDGGQSWQDTALAEPDRIGALALAAGGALLAAGDAGTLLRSDDGGASWDDLAARTANPFRALRMESASDGWAVGPTGAIHHTADGGATWTTQGGLGSSTLESIVRATATTLYACGSSAFVASTDDGASWTVRNGSLDCHALRFTSALDGIAGTRYGVFWTDDGGFTWNMASNGGLGTGGVFDFAFQDANHGFAAAGIGRILETADGGRSWSTVHSEPAGVNSYLLGIAFANATRGYAVGMDGVILVTANGGASWEHRTSGVSVELHDVRATGASEALVAGAAGTVLSTVNGGASWSEESTPTEADLWSIASADGTPLIAGDWGTVLAPQDACSIFCDDFESGGLSAWSTSHP